MNFFNGFYVTFFVGGPNRISIFYKIMLIVITKLYILVNGDMKR